LVLVGTEKSGTFPGPGRDPAAAPEFRDPANLDDPANVMPYPAQFSPPRQQFFPEPHAKPGVDKNY